MYACPWLFYTYVTIIGLLVGSFLNVVIYRLPIMMENEFKDDYQEYFHPNEPLTKREQFNLSVPRSHCPNCGHKISWWENIPLFSFLFLRGKCYGCGQHISWRYPIVESFTAFISFLIALRFGPTAALIGALILSWALIAMAGIDFDKMIIPDEIVYPIMWIGLLFNLTGTFVSLNEAVIGAIAGYLVLWSVSYIFKLITKKEGMGHGDFKLTALIGAWLGWKCLFFVIIGGAFIGLICGIVYIITRKSKTDKPFPFGPSLAAAGFGSLMFGQEIFQWYVSRILYLS